MVPLDPTPRVTRQLLSQQLWTGRRELFFVRRKRAIVRVNESCGGDVSRSSRNRRAEGCARIYIYIYVYRIRSRVDSPNV